MTSVGLNPPEDVTPSAEQHAPHAHPLREMAIEGFQHEVIRGVHQIKGMTEPVVMLDDISEEGHDAMAIGIIKVKGRTGIATSGHMVDRTGKFNASGSCHRASRT